MMRSQSSLYNFSLLWRVCR